MRWLGLGLLVVFVPMAVLVPLVAFPVIAPLVNDQRVDSTSESLGCTTAAEASSCTVQLSYPHMHYDTTEMTVTETSPGSADRTANTSVSNADRQTLVITGLSPSTTYQFTVAYVKKAAGLSDEMADALGMFPLVFLLGPLVVGMMAAVWLLWKTPMPGLVRGGIVLGMAGLTFYLLPTIQSWANSIAADSNISSISGYVGVVKLMPFLAVGVVVVTLLSILFLRRRSA